MKNKFHRMYGGLKNKYSILIVTKPEVTHCLMLS